MKAKTTAELVKLFHATITNSEFEALSTGYRMCEQSLLPEIERLEAEVKDCQSLILAFANDDQLTIDTDVRVIGLEKEIARLQEQIKNFPSDCPNCACSI